LVLFNFLFAILVAVEGEAPELVDSFNEPSIAILSEDCLGYVPFVLLV
jgi:hypothetical protein